MFVLLTLIIPRFIFFCLAHVLCLFCLHRNPRSLYLSGSEILTATAKETKFEAER